MTTPAGSTDFSSYIFQAARERGYTAGRFQDSAPLSRLSYPQEVEVKNRALGLFWKDKALEGHPEPLVESPKPRNYRSTSKRRLFRRGNRYLLLLDPKAEPEGCAELSDLEPEKHGEIFLFLSGKLNTPGYKILAEALNYVILRESEGRRAVIFNIHKLSSQEVRKIKLLSEHLVSEDLSVFSVFYYYDPTKSSYYLESSRPEDSLNFRKIYGPPKLMLKLAEHRFFYSPTVFSQVNPFILPEMINRMREMISAPFLIKTPEEAGHTGLAPREAGLTGIFPRLVDLYCGYGLFGILFSGNFREVYSMELNPQAIRDAWENSKNYERPQENPALENPSLKGRGKRSSLKAGEGVRESRFHFKTENITRESLEKFLPPLGKPEIVILDPPRGGAGERVISALAVRRPLGILHLFCNPDILPLELKIWKSRGYTPKRILPVDMFPGTSGAEILVFLQN